MKIVASRLLLVPQRLYREDYHKQKDKIHTTYDTPDIRQVKMNQEHLSDVRDSQRRSSTPFGFFVDFNGTCFRLSSCGTKRNTTAPEAS